MNELVIFSVGKVINLDVARKDSLVIVIDLPLQTEGGEFCPSWMVLRKMIENREQSLERVKLQYVEMKKRRQIVKVDMQHLPQVVN